MNNNILHNLSETQVSKDFRQKMIIAGPCSAETEEQVMETAMNLAKYGIKIFRSGIWKPRTRPGMFEGIGSVGLQWLQRVKEETGMQTAVEVANVKHVYEALKAGIDYLWVGARTTSNPFSVQEVADSLKGVDVPVIVKNPVNPDIELWLGAIERFQLAGIKQIYALHRGFSSLSNSKYRNEPNWQIPIELRLRTENIPILCDPSHISGRRDLIAHVSQKAMDLNYDGLMIESHINPDCALSDSKQQVTPDELFSILKNLIIRSVDTQDDISSEKLEELRVKIDELDNYVFEILKKRMSIVSEIGKIKKVDNTTVFQPERWKAIMKEALAKGAECGLSERFIHTLFESIHQESIDIQEKIINS